MRDKIKLALKNKYSNLGLSDKALDSVATALEQNVKTEDQIETAVAGVEGILRAWQSDSDSLRTDKKKVESELEDLKKKAADKDGGDPEKKTQPKDVEDKDEAPKWAKGLIDRISKLEGDKISSSRKQKFEEIVNKIPELQRKPFTLIPYDKLSDDEFNSLVEEVTKQADEIVKSNNSNGAVFGSPAVPDPSHNAEEKVPDSVMEELKAQATKGKVTEGQAF
jgi:Asp-tRNA(Asn)/Glu-tRNA(Gln) amidotransferase C subunit